MHTYVDFRRGLRIGRAVAHWQYPRQMAPEPHVCSLLKHLHPNVDFVMNGIVRNSPPGSLVVDLGLLHGKECFEVAATDALRASLVTAALVTAALVSAYTQKQSDWKKSCPALSSALLGKRVQVDCDTSLSAAMPAPPPAESNQ